MGKQTIVTLLMLIIGFTFFSANAYHTTLRNNCKINKELFCVKAVGKLEIVKIGDMLVKKCVSDPESKNVCVCKKGLKVSVEQGGQCKNAQGEDIKLKQTIAQLNAFANENKCDGVDKIKFEDAGNGVIKLTIVDDEGDVYVLNILFTCTDLPADPMNPNQKKVQITLEVKKDQLDNLMCEEDLEFCLFGVLKKFNNGMNPVFV